MNFSIYTFFYDFPFNSENVCYFTIFQKVNFTSLLRVVSLCEKAEFNGFGDEKKLTTKE